MDGNGPGQKVQVIGRSNVLQRLSTVRGGTDIPARTRRSKGADTPQSDVLAIYLLVQTTVGALFRFRWPSNPVLPS